MSDALGVGFPDLVSWPPQGGVPATPEVRVDVSRPEAVIPDVVPQPPQVLAGRDNLPIPPINPYTNGVPIAPVVEPMSVRFHVSLLPGTGTDPVTLELQIRPAGSEQENCLTNVVVPASMTSFVYTAD